MSDNSAFVEMMRWGNVTVPGIIFEYSKELDLTTDDIGILTTILYAYQQSKPLYNTGVEIGKILQVCPSLSKQKLTSKLSRLRKLGVVEVLQPGNGMVDKIVYIEPLMDRLQCLIIRDHPQFSGQKDTSAPSPAMIKKYEEQIEQLQLQLQERQLDSTPPAVVNHRDFKKVADFIAEKTGSLVSPSMVSELRRWLGDMALKPELLLCMLELCFERGIKNPREISRIASDVRKYAITNLDGLEVYFSRFVDRSAATAQRTSSFDPDLMELGTFTGIDMEAEARRRVYHRWRYDWGFSHAMIMKAGEIMCQRTKSGGLEYMDSVLSNWMSKEIRQLDEVDAEIKRFKLLKRKSRREGDSGGGSSKPKSTVDYEIYIPPNAEEIKTKV